MSIISTTTTQSKPRSADSIITRSADAVIMGAIEAYREGGLIQLATYRIWITEPEWRSVGRRLVAYGCPVLSKGLDRLSRLSAFVRQCVNGSWVDFSHRTTTPNAVALYPSVDEIIAERVAIVAEIATLACKAARPIDGTTRPATPADDHITLEALKSAGWDHRYFRKVENSWAISVNAIVASEGKDARIRAEIDEFHHFHDQDDHDALLTWLKIIGSPIADEHDRPIFAWDEFLNACLYGTPLSGTTTPPDGTSDPRDPNECTTLPSYSRSSAHSALPSDASASAGCYGGTMTHEPIGLMVESVPMIEFTDATEISDDGQPVGVQHATARSRIGATETLPTGQPGAGLPLSELRGNGPLPGALEAMEVRSPVGTVPQSTPALQTPRIDRDGSPLSDLIDPSHGYARRTTIVADSYSRYPCPVCGAEVTESNWHDEIFGGSYLVEYNAKCPNGDWGQEMSYGAYRETVNGREWTWSHRETPEDQAAREAEIQAEIQAFLALGL